MSILKIKFVIANSVKQTRESLTNQIDKSNVTVVFKCGLEPKDISQFYNECFLEEPRSDIYGFLIGGDELYKDALSEVIKAFEKDLALTGVVYFDKHLRKTNDTIHSKTTTLLTQLYPPFELGVPTVYSPTIFVNGGINAPIFNPQLNNLRNLDVIHKLGKTSKIIHIPKILMSSEYSQVNIKDEWESYVRQSGS